ncbi:MAG: PD40 domain-containing protein, partial [Verrucomicrobia bacterium]|nr:PD40 domain-containing protein [Verrucomicrobiota bacterium]
QIAFCADLTTSPGTHRLYVTSTNGGPGIQLSDVYCGNPSWSPDGSWLAFTRATNSTYGNSVYVGDIWRVSVEGTNLIDLTTNTPLGGTCAYPTVFEPPQIVLYAPEVSKNGTVIRWSGGAGLLQTVQEATNGLNKGWTTLVGATNMQSTGATLTVTDAVLRAADYYRILAQPEPSGP